MASRNELKKALIAQGFEVYRTLPDRVVLAERVRDNLIMDSGVSAVVEPSLSVRFAVRAQRSDFVGEEDDALFERARTLAADSRESGYVEASAQIVPIQDPGDKDRTLDTWFEVVFERQVESLDELFDELRRVLALEKTAVPVRRR